MTGVFSTFDLMARAKKPKNGETFLEPIIVTNSLLTHLRPQDLRRHKIIWRFKERNRDQNSQIIVMCVPHFNVITDRFIQISRNVKRLLTWSSVKLLETISGDETLQREDGCKSLTAAFNSWS